VKQPITQLNLRLGLLQTKGDAVQQRLVLS